MNDKQLQIIAIVGRPNVGKSTLFNRILERPCAVTDEKSGTTRDSQTQAADWNGRSFQLIDTGGIVFEQVGNIEAKIREQVKKAIRSSHLVVFLVDGQAGPTDTDQAIAHDLQKKNIPVLLVANKVEETAHEADIYDFMSLGFGEPVPVSAMHGKGIGDLLDKIIHLLPLETAVLQSDSAIKIALIGRPNVGKSTLVNSLLRQDRMITDNMPGTTRDAIDSYLSASNGQIYCLIDTAGLRKTTHISDDIEKMSALRTRESIERCDIAAVLVDISQGLQEQDLKIIADARDEGKGVIAVLNKWDLVEKDSKTFDALVRDLSSSVQILKYVPIISMSARSGQRVDRLLETAHKVWLLLNRKYSREELSSFLFTATDSHPHPAGKKFVIFYRMAQKSLKPPVFEILTNAPRLVRESYISYLYNKFYEHFECSGCPIKFEFAKKLRRKPREYVL
ncbi:MAG: ribosome biogenesis GTPase Der [Candidatus Raymondbacteria bacterium RifOxyA12_full_50_37]|uniref:GTPase Der n=1 Tax=Candidatus Raymondbacteria bacterium RIFOXYD12_FULL_49_13 TaxID=1817890 RepID=A0A1F7F1T0_UNCRA|nr:MAG: ribosome biogenesis GTPase Der [Candidatus Raymondbacteria bacterium RifOxyA12_full_50_37]OGJ93140.1 MAG: ribosome biogenesis GTPase Der [Candidatus Raymondbacteria bacterium RifOxyB12_full_50_8]OGJ93908.1 MAG: ribosome biogenesis GTPase Der [Candidatus Raymondbacteria bacterium RIFOXYA2_FULL_49_16]OGJ98223.1 MAG: ribosome biogenesis GTPase Der [Candidatus Raymondbacteria bacterium RIFOXYC2_FULL_50_21]OGK00456.1 MAG: ribosome biogenesis GTPase Der [Candidatus Raymondbacteria bacterium R